MRHLIIFILFLNIGCLNSSKQQFERFEISEIDSVVISEIDQENFNLMLNSSILNQTQIEILVSKLNLLKGGRPWIYMPEYIIEIHQRDSVRTLRVLQSEITENGGWSLDLKDDTFIQNLINFN